MEVFIGDPIMFSSMGEGAEETWKNLSASVSGIKKFENAGFGGEAFSLGKISTDFPVKFNDLVSLCLENLVQEKGKEFLSSPKTKVILSTTKGDMEGPLKGNILATGKYVNEKFSLASFPYILCHGCASGVMAINAASDLIRNKVIKNAVVIGADLVSDFVVYGFQSLFALSGEICKPFDANRNGINLGEAGCALVLSSEPSLFNGFKAKHLAGTTSNDANHISGPSRTGEGLFRSVKKTMALAKKEPVTLSYISAHGTGTTYNDEMESIAFNRLGMEEVPVNSLKGYFGHTLGAAGVIETAVCLQSLQHNALIPSYGFSVPGTSGKLNLIKKFTKVQHQFVLKTVSGFGGTNASLLLGPC